MGNLSSFCTCQDLECPLHPTNHDEGCSLCISKNLKLKEIPNCFFNMVKGTETNKGYSFYDFAELVMKNKQ